MSVEWSAAMSCYTYSCIFGCFDYDFEGEQEALEAFMQHECGDQA